MSSRTLLQELASTAGVSTVAYVDGPRALPQVEEESRREALLDRLRSAGAPKADVEAIDGALAQANGTPSPSARYLVARNGSIEADITFPGHRFGSEIAASGPLPTLLPLIRHRSRRVRYLVIETDREGAEVRLERADQHTPEHSEQVEGRTDSLTKVQTGGTSHARYQRAAEEVWKHTQSEVAEVTDRLVKQHRPDFILISGDVRARQLLIEGLSDASSALVHEFEVHTRADGADDDGIANAIAEIAESHVANGIAAVVDRARSSDGALGAEGVQEVVEALQQARVDTLVLDARLEGSSEQLHALSAEPWVSEDAPNDLDAESLGMVSAAEALARAAVLTGARVIINEEQFESEDSPRAHAEPDPPIASLRWATELSSP
ncbi:Vms1/Ankzf1 family peptidyl-tRNA hydrolase [Leucobacter denitrificans]|uniref:Peptide chain release factor 1 n=1 Tax=Leucobacter denitrificans TaxID=683042 RepID=A0A7G9S4A3_9MICO|nr:Vms1/Ankzf1 family peptidyl-tRNA hydrolase [Leucobacter denitrificans]QNN62678.1 hypothetical protein H9L06_10690 [Leucobacter denitrificans]